MEPLLSKKIDRIIFPGGKIPWNLKPTMILSPLGFECKMLRSNTIPAGVFELETMDSLFPKDSSLLIKVPPGLWERDVDTVESLFLDYPLSQISLSRTRSSGPWTFVDALGKIPLFISNLSMSNQISGLRGWYFYRPVSILPGIVNNRTTVCPIWLKFCHKFVLTTSNSSENFKTEALPSLNKI